jgi:hypothetical protein
MAILTFIKTNIFWIIFGALSAVVLFVLIKMIAPIRRQINSRKNKPQFRQEMPEVEETEFEEVKPRVVENEAPEIRRPTDYDISAIPNPAKIQKKEIIKIPKRIISYDEVEDGDRKKLKEEIKKLKTEIRDKEKENNRKTIVQEKEAKPAKKVKKETAKKTKKKVAKKK